MALALDGSVGYDGGDPSSTGNAAVVSLSTAGTNRVIYVCVISTGNITGVSGGGLTWSLRANGDGLCVIYTAVASAQLAAASITVTFDPGTTFASVVAFGISGANYSSPFDPNGSLPNIQFPRGTIGDGLNGTITTSNANDFLIGFYGSGLSDMVPGATWTEISSVSFLLVEYKIVSATQSAATVPATVTDSVGFIADAVKEFSASAVHGPQGMYGLGRMGLR